MRLINTESMRLVTVVDQSKVEYAILSHRWQDHEITFQDMRDPEAANSNDAFTKIEGCCQQARKDDIRYIWLDTCCINKDSDAEVSEAINSMYLWYQAASVCYVYLHDVTTSEAGVYLSSQFWDCKWFTRGWTLQELLAPRCANFYNCRWEFLGTKETLSAFLSARTGIDEAVLTGRVDPTQCSIAKRMSWASGRQTTRQEDIAYCLQGIFDVQMPVFYGEGSKKAFQRLQQGIIAQSDDHSIFAWPIKSGYQSGMLADSPSDFEGCQTVGPVASRRGRTAYAMTNRGLSMTLEMLPWAADTYLARLDCAHIYDATVQGVGRNLGSDGSNLCIFLRRLLEDDQYIRVTHNGETFGTAVARSLGFTTPADVLFEERPSASGNRELRILMKQARVNIKQATTFDPHGHKARVLGFQLANSGPFERSGCGQDMFTIDGANWNFEKRLLTFSDWQSLLRRHNGTAHIAIKDPKHQTRLVTLGFDFDFNPVCFVAASDGLPKASWPGTSSTYRSDTEETRAQLRSIMERTPDDRLGWSEVVQPANAYPLHLHPGLWALKGDRVGGLNVTLWYSSERALGNLRIERVATEAELFWQVGLHEFKGMEEMAFFRHVDPSSWQLENFL